MKNGNVRAETMTIEYTYISVACMWDEYWMDKMRSESKNKKKATATKNENNTKPNNNHPNEMEKSRSCTHTVAQCSIR